MRNTIWLLSALALSSPVLAQDRGLQASADDLEPAHWQARFERVLNPLQSQVGTPLWLLDRGPRAMRLLGDYQFHTLRLGQAGGLRLTGGVLINLRQPGVPGLAADTAQPWLLSGSGYAGLSYATGGTRGDWGFTADLGLTGLAFGQSQAKSLGAGWGWRSQQGLQPELRLGMRLSF